MHVVTGGLHIEMAMRAHKDDLSYSINVTIRKWTTSFLSNMGGGVEMRVLNHEHQH